MRLRLFVQVAATNWLPAIIVFCVSLPIGLYEPLDNPAHDASFAFLQAAIVASAFCVATLALDLSFLFFKQVFLLLGIETTTLLAIALAGTCRQYQLLTQEHRIADATLTAATSTLLSLSYLAAQWLRAKRIRLLFSKSN